ncbi:hypothetical protein B8V81_1535 [Paenibacillus pasadenensis]|uniref:Uncharacterized protein n=1 Tax=Paenibacillus pasadenensis TaxID=217090 RepID=A0A2N5NAD0_9BACL|nr:hypothetical protein B8V81_1535 [Paenibacillus pasadenensis]
MFGIHESYAPFAECLSPKHTITELADKQRRKRFAFRNAALRNEKARLK